MAHALGSAPSLVRSARLAMGTRFEIVLGAEPGAPRSHLVACAEAALDEIERLDRALSLFRRDSLLSLVNREAATRPVRVDPDLFELLQACVSVFEASRGAFDISVAPLMRSLGFHDDACRDGDDASEARGDTGGTRGSAGEAQENARRLVGLENLTLDPRSRTVELATGGMRLDLGGVAKGFALDRAAEILRDEGITRALIHGGTSTAIAIGSPPGHDCWKVGIRDPRGDEDDIIGVARLHDAALSVSAPHGRVVDRGDGAAGHLIDPRTGEPARGALLAAAVAQSATLTDAWSTALAVIEPAELDDMMRRAASAGTTADLGHPMRRAAAAGLSAGLVLERSARRTAPRVAGPDPAVFEMLESTADRATATNNPTTHEASTEGTP